MHSPEPRFLIRHLLDFDVPLLVIGGLAVNAHGFFRTTEDADIVYFAEMDPGGRMLAALTAIHALWIGNEIDPATGLERVFPVTDAYLRSRSVMALETDLGYLDVFTYVPGVGREALHQILADAEMIEGIPYASLSWLRHLKAAAGRPQDLRDLERLPPAPPPTW